MKRIICFCLLALALLSNPASAAEKGYIAYLNDSEDIIVIETASGYTLGELYTYNLWEEGDMVIGELNTYGLFEIYNPRWNTFRSVYIDDIMCSRERALEWIVDKTR